MNIVFDSSQWVGHCSDGTLVIEGELFQENEQKLTVRCRFDDYSTGSDAVIRYLIYDRAINVK